MTAKSRSMPNFSAEEATTILWHVRGGGGFEITNAPVSTKAKRSVTANWTCKCDGRVAFLAPSRATSLAARLGADRHLECWPKCAAELDTGRGSAGTRGTSPTSCHG